jgi:hypothetical protein
MLSFVLYESEMSLALMEELKLQEFENKAFWKITGQTKH